jgi:phage anti-repressor protein
MLHEDLTARVLAMRADGLTQDQIIESVWGIKKGGSSKYLDARNAYQAIVRGQVTKPTSDDAPSQPGRTYTLEECRHFILRKNGIPVWRDVDSTRTAFLKALKRLGDADLMLQYKTQQIDRTFLEKIFPALSGSENKRLVFSNPALSPVVPILPEQELEKELAEIYMTIDAIDLNSDPFPVDLGEAARWLGYSGEARQAKYTAKTLLLAEFVEQVDYKVCQTSLTNPPSGGRPTEQIRLTAECFKKFCLKAGTKRAERVREYFIAAEQRFRAAFKGEGITHSEIQHTNLATVISGIPIELEDVLRRVANEAAAMAVSEVLNGVEIAFKKHQTPAEADLKRLHGNLYQQVLEQSYRYPDGVHCPCCNKPTTTWEVDHWNSKTNPARTNGWKVCRPCNQALGAAGDNSKRHQYKSRFDAFQVKCDDYEQYLKGDEVQLGLLDE